MLATATARCWHTRFFCLVASARVRLGGRLLVVYTLWPEIPGISECAQPCTLCGDPGNKPPEGVQPLILNHNHDNPKAYSQI